MRTYLHFTTMLVVAGCSARGGSVYLTIDSRVPIPSSAHLQAIATNAGKSTEPIVVPLNGRAIPPVQTLRIRFEPEDRSGPTHLVLEARDQADTVLTKGEVDFELQPGHEAQAWVTLGDADLPDLGARPDMTRLPTPSITNVIPPRASTAGGRVITVLGQAFAAGAQVSIGGVPASEVQRISVSHLEVTVPANPGKLGRVRLVVTNPDGQSATNDTGFSYYPGTVAFLKYKETRVATYLVDVAARDFDADGHTDLVVAPTTGAAFVLFGKGDGTFRAPESVPIGKAVLAVAVADLDRDGMADLAAVDSGSPSRLAVAGGGRFKAPAYYPAGNGPSHSIVLQDINTDGILDAVVCNDTDVSVFSGDGSGVFGVANTISAGAKGLWEATVGDLDHDGRPDIVAASNTNSALVLLLNTGTPQWVMEPTIALTTAPGAVAAADLNHDARADLIVTPGDDKVIGATVLLNRGLINFAPAFAMPVNYATDKTARSSTVADIDGDGELDLVVSDGGYIVTVGTQVSYLHGRGDGTFEAAKAFPTGLSPQRAVAVDLDGDGRLDIATANLDGSVSVLLNSSQ